MNSRRSKKSNSYVDETLFSSKRKKKRTRKNVATGRNIRSIRSDPNSSIVSKNDLMGIFEKTRKGNEVQRKKKEETLHFNAKKELLKKRRTKIEQIERRKKELGEQNLNDLALERKMNKQKLREKAQVLLDEQLDEVLEMNRIKLFAQGVAVRDRQIEEKEERKVEEKQYHKEMDDIMEHNRIQAQKLYEDREQRRKMERRKGAAILRQQIRDRERDREKERERKELEQISMKEHLEEVKEKERKERIKKKKETHNLLSEIARCNAEQIMLKQKQKQAELEEEKRIEEYQIEKERREEELLQEKRRLKAKKEREIAQVRAMQKRAYDTQAENDEKRAKRWQEQYERDFREKVRREVMQKQQMNKELANMRRRQMLEKEELMAEQIRLERKQFKSILKVQEKERQREKEIEELERLKKREHAENLRAQIFMKEQEEDLKKRKYFEERERLKTQLDEQKERIEVIRRKKIEEMKNAGVPKKYIVKLRTKVFQEKLRPAVRKSSGVKV